MVVGEVGPRLAVGAVVLADRAPLALAQVRTPQVPVAGLAQPVLELAEARRPELSSAPARGPFVSFFSFFFAIRDAL